MYEQWLVHIYAHADGCPESCPYRWPWPMLRAITLKDDRHAPPA
jgi:hypothetical protein